MPENSAQMFDIILSCDPRLYGKGMAFVFTRRNALLQTCSIVDAVRNLYYFHWSFKMFCKFKDKMLLTEIKKSVMFQIHLFQD